MKVLLVTKPLSPPWDDSAKLVPLALVRQAADEIQFEVLVARGDDTSWPGRVRPVPVAEATGYRTSWATRLDLCRVVLWRGRAADVVHFFFQPHPAASRTARWLARLAGRPTAHTVLSAPKANGASRLLFADRTVALSKATATRLASPGEPPPEVIPPALADETPTPPERAAAARREAGLAEPFVLYPGDYEFSGGHALLLEAWRRDPHLPILAFAGRAKTKAATAARETLAERARAHGLEKRVAWLGRVADMPGLVAAARAVVFPAESLYGKTDLPLVLLEAWRDGVPVLVSDLPPLDEAVRGAGPVLPNDAEAWARALAELDGRREEWAHAGQERWRERFGAREMGRRHVRLYAELAAGPATRSAAALSGRAGDPRT